MNQLVLKRLNLEPLKQNSNTQAHTHAQACTYTHTYCLRVHSRVRHTYALMNLGEMEHSLSNGGLDNTLSLVSQRSFSHLLDQLDHLKGHLLGHGTPHVPSLHLDSRLPHDRLWTEEAREGDSRGTSVPHEGLENVREATFGLDLHGEGLADDPQEAVQDAQLVDRGRRVHGLCNGAVPDGREEGHS